MATLNKVYLEENIYYIENFITDEEIDEILGWDFQWTSKNRHDPHENVLTSSIPAKEANRFSELVKDKIALLLNNDEQKFRQRDMLTKYMPKDHPCDEKCGCKGNALGYHYENHPQCDYESRWITLGVVLYFNDDYEEGELVFEHKPISIKPKKGSLMVFPASEEYSHAVKEVYGRERIVYAAFVYGNQYWDILRRSGLVSRDI